MHDRWMLGDDGGHEGFFVGSGSGTDGSQTGAEFVDELDGGAGVAQACSAFVSVEFGSDS